MKLPNFRNSYSGILTLLIILMIFHSSWNKFPLGELITNIVFTGILLSGTFLAHNNTKVRKFVIATTLLALASRWAIFSIDLNTVLVQFSLLLNTFAIVLVCYVIIRQILNIKTVDFNIIAGAITVYILIGLAFAMLHSFVALQDLNAYKLPETLNHVDFSSFVYFSLVSLTTLGFGDATPISGLARNITILEAIVGQMFVAILIGQIVGLSISNRTKQD